MEKAHILHVYILATEIERPAGAHGDAPHMRASIFATRHRGAHDIARLKAKMPLLASQMSCGKAIGIGATPLAASVPYGADAQRLRPCDIQRFWGTRPNTAASPQWDLEIPRRVRLYFVRPPVPHSTGKPVAQSWA